MSWLCEELKFEKDWYLNLIKNGNEKIIIAEFIKRNLMQSRIGNFLEVGMGTNPIFAALLSSEVKDYLIVEKEEVGDCKLPENVRLLTDDFEKIQLNNMFDLILLSHVIYYFQDLKASIRKVLSHLTKTGKAVFVVNGPENDYGRLKGAFSSITNTSWTFTYHRLKEQLKNCTYEEYSIESCINFKIPEELYESVRLFFDVYPVEFNEHKREIIKWMEENIQNNIFKMDQKIIVVGANYDF